MAIQNNEEELQATTGQIELGSSKLNQRYFDKNFELKSKVSSHPNQEKNGVLQRSTSPQRRRRRNSWSDLGEEDLEREVTSSGNGDDDGGEDVESDDESVPTMIIYEDGGGGGGQEQAKVGGDRSAIASNQNNNNVDVKKSSSLSIKNTETKSNLDSEDLALKSRSLGSSSLYHSVRLQLAKVRSLRAQYETGVKCNEALEKMVKVIRSRDCDKELKANEKMLVNIERQLQRLIGTFTMTVLDIQGWARICPRDHYEIEFRHGRQVCTGFTSSCGRDSMFPHPGTTSSCSHWQSTATSLGNRPNGPVLW